MKKFLMLAIVLSAVSSFAEVCQIKSNFTPDMNSINIYALKQGDTTVREVTLYPRDFQYLVELRDSLIEKGVCEGEVNLEKCSITLEPTSMNAVVVNIGSKKLNAYGGNRLVTTYDLNVAAKTIKMLQEAKVCK